MSHRRSLRDEIREAIEAETRPAHPALAARIREGIEQRPAGGPRVPRLAVAIATLVAVAVIAGLVATSRLIGPAPAPAVTPTPAPLPTATAPVVVVTPQAPPPTAAPAPTTSSAPFVCTTGPSSGAASGPPIQPSGGRGITTIRAGAQPGYDRFVMEFDGGVPEYVISPQSGTTFARDPTGQPVTLRGSAGLGVVLRGAKRGDVPYLGPTSLTPGLTEIQEVQLTGDFEGVVSFGIGLARPGCYRVLTLTNPSRLVIDVVSAP